MRKLITKGEIAELLELTKSQVRFYEKKGLIKPQIDDNGYAMYDFKELDTLELVVLLKELNTPIKEIKKIIDDETKYDYPSLLKKSSEKIELEIERLTKQKHIINQRLRAFNDDEMNIFKRIYCDERLIYMMNDEHMIDDIKNVYDLMKKHNLRYLDYDNELYSITRNQKERFGFVNLKGLLIDTVFTKEQLPKGDYYSCTIRYNYNDDYSEYEKRFRLEAKNNHIKLADELIFIDHFGRKFYEKHHMIGTLQARILE